MKCRSIIKEFQSLHGLKAGQAPANLLSWLRGLDLPGNLLQLLQSDWPLTDCELGVLRLHSCRSMKADKATRIFLKHKLLLVGSMLDGDWVVVDFSTNACKAAIIPHDDDWNPWDNNFHDPRHLVRACALEELLEAGLDDAWPDRHHQARKRAAAANRGPLVFSFVTPPENSCFTSVPVPKGFKVKAEPHAPDRFWLSPPKKKGSMVVSAFSPKHQCVKDAKAESMNFRKFPIGKDNWYLAMPDPKEESLDSFFAILPLKKVAIAAYGSDLNWREKDVKQFLAALKYQDK
jgi:hypothetical protein